MPLGDLPHQRQPQAHPAGPLGMAGQAEEGFEDALAVGLGHPGPTVADAHRGSAGRSRLARGPWHGRHLHGDLPTAITLGVFEQVAHRAPQQALVSLHLDVLAAGAGARARGLLGGQGEQGHGLLQVQRHAAVQPAGQQHFFDERVELADVGVDLLAQRGALPGCGVLQHRHGHLQPRQRAAQLVAGVGQQALVRAQQRLDARRGPVEAGAQRSHLVAALFGHALVQRTGAESLDAQLQRFEPARQAAHHGPGARRHGQEQHHQQGRQAEPIGPGGQAAAHPGRTQVGRRPAGTGPPGPVQARHPQRAAVIEADGPQPRGPVGGVEFAAQEGIGGADAPAVSTVQRHGQAQPLAPLAQPGLLLGCGGLGGRQRALQQFPPGFHALARSAFGALALLVQVLLHQPARHQRKQRQRGHHREVDAKVQGAQGSTRPRPASSRTRSRRRAPSARAWATWGRPRSRRGCARCARRCCGRRPPAGGPSACP